MYAIFLLIKIFFEDCLMYKWFGIFSELDLSISGWFFLIIFLILILSFGFFLILNVKNNKNRVYATFITILASLFLFGIVGFLVISTLFFIIYALRSDFKKDYE